MRIAVIGAGAMGSIYGGHLSLHNDVYLVDTNPNVVAAVNENGLKLQEYGTDNLYHPKAVTSTEGIEPVDLIILFVKALFSKAALAGNKALIGPDTYVLTLQNGSGHEDILGEFVDLDHIIIGTTEDNGAVLGMGYIRHGGEGNTNVGMLVEDKEGFLPKLKESFDACGFNVRIHSVIQQLIWDKLFTNVSLSAVTGVLQCEIGYIAANEYAWKMTTALIHEAVEVAHALSLAACGGGGTTTREDTNASSGAAAGGSSAKVKVDPYAGDEVKIAYIAHDIGTPNNQGWKEGIERECGSWSNIKVDSYGAEESAETQVQIMTDCINQGYNAIILQCSDGTALAPSVKQAEEAGIPVITVNLDCASDTIHSALVMAVDYDAGRMAADKMAEQMGGSGKIAIIQGVPGLERTDNLEKGFRDTIANYSGIEIVDAQSASFQKDTAMTVMNSFLQSYPDLKGVFAINDAMAEGAALAAQSANKKGQICIWGADGEKDALAMIESGDMAGTIYTNSWDEGSTAAKIALLMIGSEYDYTCLTATPKVIMEPIVVTAENVNTIAEEDRW